jgi:hypothetical protein
MPEDKIPNPNKDILVDQDQNIPSSTMSKITHPLYSNLASFIVLILSILWLLDNPSYEPLIGIVVSIVSLVGLRITHPRRIFDIIITIVIIMVSICGFIYYLTYPSPDKPFTKVIRYVPNIPADEQPGYCWRNSGTPKRPDAWRCTVENHIFDPCFEIISPFGPRDEENTVVVCGSDPINNEQGFRLNLTQPLPQQNKHDLSEDPSIAWIIELDDGRICRFSYGATGAVFNDRANYMCEGNMYHDGGWIIGYPKTGNTWQAELASFNENFQIKNYQTVTIRTVWR